MDYRYYHLTRLCFDRNREVLERAFKAIEPNNVLSENWNFLSTECVVKSFEVDCVGPGVITVYKQAPTEKVNSVVGTGKSE